MSAGGESKQPEDPSRLVTADFKRWKAENPDSSIANAAIQALTKMIERSKARTIMELQIQLQNAVSQLRATDPSSISLEAGCKLFMRNVIRVKSSLEEQETIVDLRSRLIERGKVFAKLNMEARPRIARFGARFIRDGTRILIHGRSRVVNRLIMHAHELGKNFSVTVTEGRPDYAGYVVAEELKKAGIVCRLILDSAVATYMSEMDMVLVGAEGVVESGGVINKVGTYQIAMVASLLNKPLYVAAESYKFARIFPLSQKDIPQRKEAKFEPVTKPSSLSLPKGVPFLNPSCDYTPPNFITIIVTDLGTLTPSAISDELIKLYT